MKHFCFARGSKWSNDGNWCTFLTVSRMALFLHCSYYRNGQSSYAKLPNGQMIPATFVSGRQESQEDAGRKRCCGTLHLFINPTSEAQCLKYVRPKRWLPQNHLPCTLTDYCLPQEHSFQQILHLLACPISGTTVLRENGCCVVTSQEERTRNTPGSMDQVSATQNAVIIPHFSTCL